jgi:hypothetical protein
MLKASLLFTFFMIWVQGSWAQISWPFESINSPVYSHYTPGFTIFGCGVSTFDVNEDGWDDLTVCQPHGNTLDGKHDPESMEMKSASEVVLNQVTLLNFLDRIESNSMIHSSVSMDE